MDSNNDTDFFPPDLLDQTSLLNFNSTNSSSVLVHHNYNYNNETIENLYQVPVGIVIVLSTFYGSISLLTVIGNGLVLWVVTVSRRMRTVTNMFIANLALADIIIGLFAIPFQFQAALLQKWNLPAFMCAFCPFVQVLSVNVSVFTLATIALDRYRAVLHPLKQRPSKRKAVGAIISIWSVGLLLALPTELDYRVIYQPDVGDQLKPFCHNDWLPDEFRRWYNMTLIIIQYFFPLTVITAAYARMAGTLWGTTAPGNAEDSRDAAILRNKKKVIKMLAVVVLLFALCWLPLQSYNFLSSYIEEINKFQYINMVWFGMHMMAMSNSCCNPFIYAIYNDKFQREFRARLRCMSICIGRRADSPCSEVSDFDRSKIRASYRFHEYRRSQKNGGLDGDSLDPAAANGGATTGPVANRARRHQQRLNNIRSKHASFHNNKNRQVDDYDDVSTTTFNSELTSLTNWNRRGSNSKSVTIPQTEKSETDLTPVTVAN